MTEPVLQGDLAAFRLPEVLTFLSTSRKSGTLTLRNGVAESYLFFDDGSLVYASSTNEQFRLGSILQRKKRISREQRERIDALMQREGGRFGQFAVQEGILTEAQLRDYLKVQVSEIVYDCFVWDGGAFAFAQEARLPGHAVTISIDLGNLMMEGARRIDEWEQCLKLLPDKRVIYRVVASPRDEKITLSADEWKILFLINGRRTLEELCHDAEEDPFDVYRVVYGLQANQLIEVAPPPERDDDTGTGRTKPMPAIVEDATVRQSSPSFGGDETLLDSDDDTSLLVSSEARLSYADVVRPTIAQFTIEHGETIPLTEAEYSLGRHRDNSIVLHDPGVSGFHARLYRGADGYVIEDLKSRNGTFVNGSRVFHATLRDGDRVHVGQTDLIYELLY